MNTWPSIADPLEITVEDRIAITSEIDAAAIQIQKIWNQLNPEARASAIQLENALSKLRRRLVRRSCAETGALGSTF